MSEKFDGFVPPEENWSKLPHAFIEAMPMMSSRAEICVVLYILRHTWGYREYEEGKRISTDEFANGRKRRDGTRIDNGVGMSFPSIRSGIKSAIEHGFIEVETDDTDKARIEKFYSLKMSGVKSLPSVGESDGKEFTITGKEFTTEHRKKPEERDSSKKDSAPKNGAGATAQQPKARKPDPLYDAIESVWGFTAARNKSFGKMLTGVATRNGLKECNIEPAMTPDEVTRWAAWWKIKNPGLTMMAAPEKVQSSVYEWRTEQAKPAAPGVKELYELPTADEMERLLSPWGADVYDDDGMWIGINTPDGVTTDLSKWSKK